MAERSPVGSVVVEEGQWGRSMRSFNDKVHFEARKQCTVGVRHDLRSIADPFNGDDDLPRRSGDSSVVIPEEARHSGAQHVPFAVGRFSMDYGEVGLDRGNREQLFTRVGAGHRGDIEIGRDITAHRGMGRQKRQPVTGGIEPAHDHVLGQLVVLERPGRNRIGMAGGRAEVVESNVAAAGRAQGACAGEDLEVKAAKERRYFELAAPGSGQGIDECHRFRGKRLSAEGEVTGIGDKAKRLLDIAKLVFHARPPLLSIDRMGRAYRVWVPVCDMKVL